MTNIFSPAHPPTDEFIDETWRLTAEDGGLAMIPRLIRYMAERRTYRERWVTPLVDKIVPIRLIDGIDDPISGKHMADRFAEVVPDADVVYLPDSGHYPHVETPEAVLDAFFAFHDTLQRSKTLTEQPPIPVPQPSPEQSTPQHGVFKAFWKAQASYLVFLNL